ncbi:hypothetical protein KP509_02G055700 [Ceratopteris richardii]|uniref:Nodulin-like domain-containing protein n=1 Tax=Ceratopteris richardii TaxID=49495 RepID=A0A8T2VD64_CERRI|nr:hypothetical protein KP509_02G055700 [Ceratopteris richardii]
MASLKDMLWRPRSRWTVLIFACWAEATAGLSYVFSTYSGALKSELSYDQRHINRLSVAKDLGDTVGIAAGLLCRVLPSWSVLLTGGFLIFVGYGLLWLFTDHYISNMPFWLVCILIFLGTNGCTYIDTVALIACIPNFPSNRASAVGILKGFKGLCGAIFNQIYASFLAPDESSFILMLALGPAVVIVPVIFFMGPLTYVQDSKNQEDTVMFRLLYAASLLLAAYMLAVTLVQDLYNISNTINVILTVILFFILLLPLPIPVLADRFYRNHNDDDDSLKDPFLRSEVEVLENASSSEVTSDEKLAVSCISSKENSEDGSPGDKKKVSSATKIELAGANLTLRQAFQSLNFWLLFLCIFLTLGSGTTAFNNLAQMGEAQGYTNTEVFVSMSNIWNFIGRLAGGYLSEISTRTYGHPRIVTLAIFQLLMALGHLFYAMAWSGTIYIAVFLVALGYGAHWAIFPTALSELFGFQNFAMLYNILTMASPAGSLIYSGCIAGPIYDWQARRQHSASSGDTTLVCEGSTCFEITFLIMAGMCVIGALVSVTLALRTRSN